MSLACGKRSSSARMAASESEQLSTIACPWRSAALTPGRAASSSSGASGRVARIVRAPDRRLDLGRRAVRDDPPAGHQHGPVGVVRRPPRGSGSRTGSSCPARPTRASSPRRPAAPRRPSPPSARRGSSRSGLLTSATAKRTRWVWPPESFWVRCRGVSSSPVSASVSSTPSGCGYSEATIAISSRTDRSRISAPALEHRPDQPVPDRLATELRRTPRRASVGPQQTEDHVDRGRLAGAVRSEQGDRLAARDRRGRSRGRLRSIRSACSARELRWRRTSATGWLPMQAAPLAGPGATGRGREPAPGS